MVLSLVPAGMGVEGEEEHIHIHVAEAQAAPRKAVSSTYFREQLNVRGKAIYDLLLREFSGANKTRYYDGVETIDLTQLPEVTDEDVQAYLSGNKDIFNDFAAAKDALDLDHSELWYLDSGYMTFRVTKEGYDTYHVPVGPGRAENYLLAGQSPIHANKGVAEMDQEVNDVIDEIVANAKKAGEDAKDKNYSLPDQDG